MWEICFRIILAHSGCVISDFQYDFVHILAASSGQLQTSMLQSLPSTSVVSRKRRSSHSSQVVNVGFLEHLNAGTWYFALYNDDDQYETVDIFTTITSTLHLYFLLLVKLFFNLVAVVLIGICMAFAENEKK